MGILKPKKAAAAQPPASTNKRSSVQADIANLKPLKPGGVLGFQGIRDGKSPGASSNKTRDEDDMDSDDDAAIQDEKDDADDDEIKNKLLSPEDARKQGEIADGVERIRVRL
jgi:hypothetical protein